MRRLPLHFTAAAFAALSLLAPGAAQASQLFDVGPAGPVEAATAVGEATGAQANDAIAATTTAAQTTAVTNAAPATPVTSTDQVAATVTESRLPAWLQVVVARAPLYATDSSGNQALGQLTRYTFLRVIAGGTNRLQVQAFDENGNPGQSGWVEADQVLPSAPGTDWLVTSAATTLWNAADSTSATKVRALDRFAPMQKLDGPTSGRVMVRVYSSDFSSVVGEGWVDAAATGPALPPQVRVPSPNASSGARSSTGSTLQQTDFLNAAAQAARVATASTGVPASVTVAQAILESDWGRSSLAQDANNYFGMKAMGTLGDDGVVWLPTSEYDATGQLYQTMSAFRAYKSLADSMADHDRLLSGLSRYASAMQAASDPRQFAQQIAADGYSTDPAYADKLIALMDHYNLYQLDS